MRRSSQQHDEDDGRHPFAERFSRFPEDDALRAAGLAIHARPKGQEAVWRRPDGALVGHGEAVGKIGSAGD